MIPEQDEAMVSVVIPAYNATGTLERLFACLLNQTWQNLQIILQAIDYVKQGVYMTIYPEGQRGTGEDERELLPFHEGSFKIATKSNCPIVPVAVCGTRERWETQFPKMRPGHVIIEFGKPIRTAEMSREELKGIGAKTRDIVLEMVVRNHDLL